MSVVCGGGGEARDCVWVEGTVAHCASLEGGFGGDALGEGAEVAHL